MMKIKLGRKIKNATMAAKTMVVIVKVATPCHLHLFHQHQQHAHRQQKMWKVAMTMGTMENKL